MSTIRNVHYRGGYYDKCVGHIHYPHIQLDVPHIRLDVPHIQLDVPHIQLDVPHNTEQPSW